MPSNNFKDYQFILASKSPRRQYLLEEIGLNFEVRIKEVEESFPEHLIAQEIPLYLCEKKANAFHEELNDHTIVITADTIVWIENQVLNKPMDYKDAVRMLKLLSGKMHEVFTGVCLKSNRKTLSFYTRTEVYFNKLSDQEIKNYVTDFQPYDKAGAYGAQECLPSEMNPCSKEEIAFLTGLNKLNLIENSKSLEPGKKDFITVEKIEGSYFNVMGLPVRELYIELQKF